jgi:nucleoside-diphosphate-sugar epimerase
VYFEMVADMLGLPKPPLLSRAEVQATVSAETWSFMTESRQVSSARIQRELGFSPQYKDLRRGIRASV